MSRRSYHVATHRPAEKGMNTLVLSGIDLVIPLEMDLDDDPLQDDEVRLSRLDGHFIRELSASHADVVREEGGERLLYTFRDVPPGVYGVQARISADEWASVLEGIVVTTKRATWNDQDLAESPDDFQGRPVDPPVHEAADEPAPPEGRFYEYAGDGTE